MLDWTLFTLYLVLGWVFHFRSKRKVTHDHKGQKDSKEVERFMRLFQAPIIFFWPLWLIWALWVKYMPSYFWIKKKYLKRDK